MIVVFLIMQFVIENHVLKTIVSMAERGLAARFAMAVIFTMGFSK